eukprot:4214174-Karenia_brevis.AAC.1
MKGCTCVLRHIVFSEDEPLPKTQVAGHAHQLRYMPISLVLQAEDVSWTLPMEELPAALPANIDRRGLFQLRPTYDYLRVKFEDDFFSVRRTSFLVSPADTIT